MIALCLALLGTVCAPDSYTETAADITARVRQVDAIDVELVFAPLSRAVTLPAPIAQEGDTWERLAECESGDWIDGGRSFVAGSARWDWGAPGVALPPWGTRLHEGGLQFAPSTWQWVAGDLGLLDAFPHAYDAPRDVQIVVAVEVQARQGWGAWPVCARKVGLR